MLASSSGGRRIRRPVLATAAAGGTITFGVIRLEDPSSPRLDRPMLESMGAFLRVSDGG
jgi:hypothetical protein